MIKTFPIDFVRQILEQTLYQKHLENENYFGGRNQISIMSFYEQLKNQDEVDRFVQNYRDLADQQNRSNLIGNGVLISPENPTITNLYTCLIVPMTWTCSIRCTLGNRDQMIATINNLIEELKGSKVDIAQLDCVDENDKHYTQPFVVGTIGHNDGVPTLKNGDYLGDIASGGNANTFVSNTLNNLAYIGVTVPNDYPNQWYYVSYQNKICVIRFNPSSSVWYIANDDGTTPDIIFPPEHESFEKYKVSLSFESIRCDEPRNLNAEEYCEISFGGSATLVSNGIILGNDLIKIAVSKTSVEAETPVSYSANTTYLEPLEMPSGNNLSNQVNQLMSARFLTKPHTDSLTPTIQYTFIVNKNIKLLNVWFDLARYGKWSLSVNNVDEKVSPNTQYSIYEWWSSWGEVKKQNYIGKIVENIDIENTESDVLTISVSFQVVGNE